MPKSVSRSVRSWLKTGNSENSPPNTPKRERSSVAEQDKKTTPTHSTPGKRVTRRNSQLDAVDTPVKTPLRNTRRTSISENDNKSVVASPLRRSVRRLSSTLEDGSAPAAATKSRRKSVIIIDSPIKEEIENTEVDTSPPRRRGRPRLVKEIKKSNKIEQVKNDVKTEEKTDKRNKSKQNSVSPTPESLIIVIDDDDDDEVDAVEVIKKNDIQVDHKIKVENIKEKAEENETTLVISQLVCNKEDDKNQSLDDCIPENDVIEKNVIGTKNKTGTVNVEKINDEDDDEVIFEKEENDSMEAIVIREDVNEKEGDENNEKLVEESESISKKEESGGKPQPPSSDKQEETGEQGKLKSQKDFVEIISDDIELNTNIQDVSGRKNDNKAEISANAATKINVSEKERISDSIVETINNSIDLFFEELNEHEMVFENEENDNKEAIVIREDVNKNEGDENNEKLVEDPESFSKKKEKGGKSHPREKINDEDDDEVIFEKEKDDSMEAMVIREDVNEKEGDENNEKLVEESESINKKEENGGKPQPPSSDKQDETEEQRKLKSKKEFIKIISDEIELNTNKDVSGENNYNEADISVNAAEIKNISEKEEISDRIFETVNKSSQLSFAEQKEHDITVSSDDKRDSSSRNEHNVAEHDHDEVIFEIEEDDNMEAFVIKKDVNEKEGNENNEKLVEESESISKKEENVGKSHAPSTDKQEQTDEQQKPKSQKEFVEIISDEIEMNTNNSIKDASGENNYMEADISVNAAEIKNISETEETNDSIVETVNESSQLSFPEQKEHEIITVSCDDKRDCSSRNEHNIAEHDHDHDEIIFEKEEDDSMEAMVVREDLNKSEGDENNKKLVEEPESFSKKEEKGGKSHPASSDKQEETDEQRKLKSQKEFVEIISDEIELNTNNSAKDVSGENNYKEADISVNAAEIKTSSETEEINDSIVETVNESSQLSFAEQKEHDIITITCDEKEDCSSLNDNNTTNDNKKTNSFEQSRFNLTENQNKSPKKLKGNSESISNGEEESEINRTNESCKKAKVRNDKSKSHKSVTFDDNTEKQLSIKYPTTPLAKGKIYSDSFICTLRNIDSSYETSVNCNTSASFKDSEENEKSQKLSINNCDTTSDCDTPYKNLNKKIKMSSSTPLPIFKQICIKNDDHVNKSNEDLIIKKNVEGSFKTNKAESFSNIVNPNQKNNTEALSKNSLNKTPTCKKLEIDNVSDNTNKKGADDTENALSILYVSSGSESDNEYESDSEEIKYLEGVRGEIQEAEKDTLLCNNRKSNLENLTQNETVKEPIIRNDEDEELTSNLELGKDVSASKENSAYFKKIPNNFNDDTPVINEENDKNINLERETCDHQRILLTTDNIPPTITQETSGYLNNSENDNKGIHNITGVSKNTENLQDNEETSTSNKGKTIICQKSTGNMNSEFRGQEEMSINNDSKQEIETSKDPMYLNIFGECEETKEILNILKQDGKSDIQMDILSETNNEIETEILNDIVEDKDEDVSLENSTDTLLKNNIVEKSLLHKSPAKQNDFEDSHIHKERKDSKIIVESLITETSEIFDCNLEDKELTTSMKKKSGNRKSLTRQSSGNSSPSIKSNNLNSSRVGSIVTDDFDRASPKIKNKNLINNKNGQEPEQEINIEENNRDENVTETISNLTSVENNKTKLKMKKESPNKNNSFHSYRKKRLSANENNLSLPFAGFDENNASNADIDLLKIFEENKPCPSMSSPTHSLNETFTSVHHLENISECDSNEENEKVSNKEICNKSTALQTKQPELEVLQEAKAQSSSFEKNNERIATFLQLEDATSENMNKTESSENEVEKLLKCSNDDSKRLSDFDANSNNITTSNMKTISEKTSDKVSQSNKSDNTIKGANSAKKRSKQQTKVKMAETESKEIINQENTSPISRKRQLKRKLAAEEAKQNLTKAKTFKEDVIQLRASHKHMEKKLNKSNAKEIVQTGEAQSSLCQKHIAKDNEKNKLEIKTMSNAKKQKERLLPYDILEAIDTQHKRSKKPHVDDSKGIKKLKTESRSDSSNKKKTSRYATTGGISDIIKNPSGIFFEEPITPERKHQSKSFKNAKRKILSTIELPTGVVYEEPVTPDHKKIVNGFKETAATPKAIGFKVKSILSAGQKEPPVYKKDTQKRRKLILDEPTMVLPKPKWATSGEFTVTKYPKPIDLDESIATEFLVTPLQSKRSKMEAGIAPLTTSAAYDFKKGALYNKQIPRETSKQLLQRKEKQKFYMF